MTAYDADERWEEQENAGRLFTIDIGRAAESLAGMIADWYKDAPLPNARISAVTIAQRLSRFEALSARVAGEAMPVAALAFQTGTPDVKRGNMRCFIVCAVSKHSGKHFTAPAYYLNGYPLEYEECVCGSEEAHGHDDGCPTTGWFRDEANFEYENCYYAFEHDIVSWAELPSPEAALHPASVTGAEGGRTMAEVSLSIASEVRRRNRIGEEGERHSIAPACEGAAADLVLAALTSCGFAVVPAALDRKGGKDAEIERLTKERDEAANDRDCFIEGKVLAEHQRDAAEATITELRKALEDAHEALDRIEWLDRMWVPRSDLSDTSIVVQDDGKHYNVLILGRCGSVARRARAIATEAT